MYPDLSTRHDSPVKKGFVLFVVIDNQVEGEFETHFREFVESVEGPEQGSLRCFADGVNQSLISSERRLLPFHQQYRLIVTGWSQSHAAKEGKSTSVVHPRSSFRH